MLLVPFCRTLVAAFLICLVAGCGSGLGSKVKASGKVTVDGQPMGNVEVTFHCTEEREAQYRTFKATAGAGGEYTIEEIFPGKYEVTVVEPQGEIGDDPGMQSAMGANTLQPAEGDSLTATVGESDLAFDIKLKRVDDSQKKKK